MQKPQRPGQTYQREDAVSMFLEGTGLIICILPKQMAKLRTLLIDISPQPLPFQKPCQSSRFVGLALRALGPFSKCILGPLQPVLLALGGQGQIEAELAPSSDV